MFHHSDSPHFSIILLYFFKTKYLEPEATCVSWIRQMEPTEMTSSLMI